MLWLLQNNLVESMTARLAWALQRMGRPVHDFSVIPGSALPAFPCRPHEPHFFYGSTGLLQRLRKIPLWCDALFGDELSLDQRHWQAHRPSDLLNGTVEFMTLQALQARQQTQSFFVRPALDQKAFSGHVALNGDLSGIFRTRKAQFREQPIDLLLAVSPVVFGIHAEYRFVVLHHQVRLGSRYRLDGQLSLEALVEPHAWAAAQALAEGWMPASFIMMDVAVFSDGSARIIEFNSVHSSGIYHIRGEDFACLVEEAVRPRSIEASRPLSLTF